MYLSCSTRQVKRITQEFNIPYYVQVNMTCMFCFFLQLYVHVVLHAQGSAQDNLSGGGTLAKIALNVAFQHLYPLWVVVKQAWVVVKMAEWGLDPTTPDQCGKNSTCLYRIYAFKCCPQLQYSFFFSSGKWFIVLRNIIQCHVLGLGLPEQAMGWLPLRFLGLGSRR